MEDVDYEGDEQLPQVNSQQQEDSKMESTKEVTDKEERRGKKELILKGRGHRKSKTGKRQPGFESRFRGAAVASRKARPAKSVEGWVVFVTGIHEEAAESDVLDMFADFGSVRSIQVNLDRRTGFVKGYALVEFEKREEAEEAIDEANGKKLLGQEVQVGWTFIQGPGSRRR